MVKRVRTWQIYGGKLQTRWMRECRCKCGYTFRVSTPDDWKYARAGLCKGCYHEKGAPGERDGLCRFPGCDEVAEGRHKYCDEHGKLMGHNLREGRRQMRAVAAAINRAHAREVAAVLAA